MKNVLIISYYWPPSGGPGVQRVLKFCKYLPKFGWRPIVLTVAKGDYPILDSSLGIDLKDIKVFQAKAFSLHRIFNLFNKEKHIPTFQLSSMENDSIFVKVSRWIRINIIIPDGRIGWYPNAVKVGDGIIKHNKIDAILSSAPPYTAHLIAKRLSLSHNIPWVADFRDPWTDRFYNLENKRLWLTEKIDKYLETNVINIANKRITVSEAISKYYTKPFHVIPNGFDEEDFEVNNNNNDNNKVVISYLGTMTKSQNPKCFFKEISNLNQKQNIYQIDLVGSIHPDIINYIYKHKFDRFIKLLPYVKHSEAIQKMVDSSFLLLIIPNTKKNKGIITGKIFEYIRSMTKIIMIGPQNSDAAKIIKETSSGKCFSYEDRDSISNYLTDGEMSTTKNFERYSRERLTEDLAKILNEAL